MNHVLNMQDISLIFSHLEIKKRTTNLWLWFAKLEDAKKIIILNQRKKLFFQLRDKNFKLDELKMLLFAIDYVQIYQKRFFRAEVDATSDFETIEERKSLSKKDKILTYILQIHKMRKKQIQWNNVYQKMLSDLKEIFDGDVPSQETVEKIYADWLRGGRTGRLHKRPKTMTDKLFDVMPEVEIMRKNKKSFAQIQSILKRRYAIFNRSVPAVSTIHEVYKRYQKERSESIQKIMTNMQNGKNAKGFYEPFTAEKVIDE